MKEIKDIIKMYFWVLLLGVVFLVRITYFAVTEIWRVKNREDIVSRLRKKGGL